MLGKFNIFKWFNPCKDRTSRERLSEVFRLKHDRFKELLDSNTELSKIIADMEEKLQGHQVFGMSYVRSQSTRAIFHTLRMIESLNALSGRKYSALLDVLEEFNSRIKEELGSRKESPVTEWTLPYTKIGREMVDSVGGKSANLGEVLNRTGLPIPEGFAITTRAFDFFLSENDLIDAINKIKMEIDANDPESINYASEEIQRLIISAPVPHELSEAILSAYDQMMVRIRRRDGTHEICTRVSLRSSAIGEDSELSFAGQYLSVLNVPREKLIQTYTYIIASLFTPRAISYRINKGIRYEDIAMSVACLQMVESVASGVAYSRHPFNLAQDNIIINAVWGLGPYAVDGIITPDSYTVAKDDALTPLNVTISHKPVQLVSNPDGGLQEIAVPEEKQDQACLSPERIALLSDYVLRLEKHYKIPQDVEWALDRSGNILILQTRPLHVQISEDTGASTRLSRLVQYPMLIENGAVAFPGVGFGKVFKVRSDDDLANFPEGAVLVAKHSSPKFVVVMQKAQAIVTDSGSVTGHMASLSREFRIPTILDARVATTSFPDGMEITVDAYTGRVYKGKVPELLSLQAPRTSYMHGTPVFETLKRVSDLIVPLRLFDPKAPEFTPENCHSLHDIMRYVHEYSYKEMFQISDLVSNGGGCATKLSAPLPLDLYIIDLGGGLKEEAPQRVTPDEITSIPFKALLKGMLHEDFRYRSPRPVELRGFFSVMSEQMLSPQYSGTERFGDRSYAIVSDKYLNFSSRVGYHYGVLDCYCGQTINKNYITFSFKGGAADDIRRNRRARAIAMILEASDFTVEVVADRVDAKLQKYDMEVIEEKLDLLGKLLQFTRQMDMLMSSETSVNVIVKSFLAGNYELDHTKLQVL
jgi:pyruvate, water dikinase